MKLFFAGVPGGGTTGDCKRERELNEFWSERLWTYYWMMKDRGRIKVDKKVELFLDSGAFSAWTQGIEIDINEYIAFIKEHQDVIDIYANLDVIGDAKATLNNQRIMENQGLNPLPIFHYGERERYLRLYIEEHDYIGLGGMVPISTKELIPWLDKLFINYICDSNGRPKVRVHGFGLTSLQLMLRYPWYSVDSTSWVITGRLGSIFVPRYVNGKWIYDEQSWKVAVSERSPKTKDAGAHFKTLSPYNQRLVMDYLKGKGYVLGKSEFRHESQTHKLRDGERWAEKKPADGSVKRLLEVIVEEGVCNRYQLRDEVNIIYFLDLEASMPEWPWAFKRGKQSLL